MTIREFFDSNKGKEGFVDFYTMVEFSESEILHWIMYNDCPGLSLEETNNTIYLDGDIYKKFEDDTPMTDVIVYIKKILLEKLNQPTTEMKLHKANYGKDSTGLRYTFRQGISKPRPTKKGFQRKGTSRTR